MILLTLSVLPGALGYTYLLDLISRCLLSLFLCSSSVLCPSSSDFLFG